MFKTIFLQMTVIMSLLGLSASTDLLKPQQVHYKDKALVLMYHEIKDNHGPFALSTKLFGEQLKALKENEYNVISIEQFEDFMTGKLKNVPPNAVVITFDDGYQDFYANAYPALAKYKYPATNFLIVKSTDIYNPNIIPHMTWDEIKEMHKHGMSFYNHSYDSHRYAKIDDKGTEAPMLASPIYLNELARAETQEEYSQRIKTDLEQANKLLSEKLGNTRNILAFPYGKYSQTTIAVGRELGIKLFFTIDEGINAPGSELVYRINAGARGTDAQSLLNAMRRYDDKK